LLEASTRPAAPRAPRYCDAVAARAAVDTPAAAIATAPAATVTLAAGVPAATIAVARAAAVTAHAATVAPAAGAPVAAAAVDVAAPTAAPAGPAAREKMPPIENLSVAYRAGAVLAARAEIHARHEQLARLHGEAADTLQAGEKLVADRRRLGEDLALREQLLAHRLGEVFQQPMTADRKLRELADRHGHERAGQLLAAHPETLAPLRGLGLAALHTTSRRGALDAAREAGRELAEIGNLTSRLSTLDARIAATAPAVAAARERFAAIARARHVLPTTASLQAEVLRAATLLGPNVVRAMSLAAAGWVARLMRAATQPARDLLLERGRGDDGLSL
jgi:hypothetical protein